MPVFPNSQSASRPLDKSDWVSLAVIAVFIVTVLSLMRMETAPWVFNYDDHFLEVRGDAPPPLLDFTLSQLEPGTIKLSLDLTNISLIAYCTAEDVARAKGHAHVFVDGRKYGSFYLTDYVLKDIPPGSHTITVSLNQPPAHKVLTWQGAPIAKSKTITIS